MAGGAGGGGRSAGRAGGGRWRQVGGRGERGRQAGAGGGGRWRAGREGAGGGGRSAGRAGGRRGRQADAGGQSDGRRARRGRSNPHAGTASGWPLRDVPPRRPGVGVQAPTPCQRGACCSGAEALRWDNVAPGAGLALGAGPCGPAGGAATPTPARRRGGRCGTCPNVVPEWAFRHPLRASVGPAAPGLRPCGGTTLRLEPGPGPGTAPRACDRASRLRPRAGRGAAPALAGRASCGRGQGDSHNVR